MQRIGQKYILDKDKVCSNLQMYSVDRQYIRRMANLIEIDAKKRTERVFVCLLGAHSSQLNDKLPLIHLSRMACLR